MQNKYESRNYRFAEGAKYIKPQRVYASRIWALTTNDVGKENVDGVLAELKNTPGFLKAVVGREIAPDTEGPHLHWCVVFREPVHFCMDDWHQLIGFNEVRWFRSYREGRNDQTSASFFTNQWNYAKKDGNFIEIHV